MPVENNNGSIRVQFQHRGRRFNLSGLGSYSNSIALARAHELEKQIKRDLKAGLAVKDSHHLREIYVPSQETLATRAALAVSEAKRNDKTLLEVWDQWVESLDINLTTKHGHYHWIRRAMYVQGLEKKGSSNLAEQIGTLEPLLTWFKDYHLRSCSLGRALAKRDYHINALASPHA